MSNADEESQEDSEIEWDLSPKQISFVEHLLRGNNATEAARLAGYNESVSLRYGHQWVNPKYKDRDSFRPELYEYLKQRQKEMQAVTKTTVEWWVAHMHELLAQAEQGGDLNSALKAMAMFQKYLGMENKSQEEGGNIYEHEVSIIQDKIDKLIGNKDTDV